VKSSQDSYGRRVKPLNVHVAIIIRVVVVIHVVIAEAGVSEMSVRIDIPCKSLPTRDVELTRHYGFLLSCPCSSCPFLSDFLLFLVPHSNNHCDLFQRSLMQDWLGAVGLSPGEAKQAGTYS
jgi:hypothetical protein